MSIITGRKHEMNLLKEAIDNNKSELVAVYGRRRVGKTFLIREYYKAHLVFELTGLYNGAMSDQLANFSKEIKRVTKKNKIDEPTNWLDAFTLLESYLNKLQSAKKKVIFIDEFPWIATARSKFLMAFENFWNHYCTKRKDLIVVICGSAASYMIQKIIKNKGGLHNRVTRAIKLLPFSLQETDLFLKSRGLHYTRYDILQIYMAMGGVPHYLEKLKKGKSVAQNIDMLCFQKDGILKYEFDRLYASLFDNSEKHLAIIHTLYKCNKGITRQAVISNSGMQSGGDFSLKLEELIESGFVTEYAYYGNKKQQSLYRLSDEYSKFYLKFIKSSFGHDGVAAFDLPAGFTEDDVSIWGMEAMTDNTLMVHVNLYDHVFNFKVDGDGMLSSSFSDDGMAMNMVPGELYGSFAMNHFKIDDEHNFWRVYRGTDSTTATSIDRVMKINADGSLDPISFNNGFSLNNELQLQYFLHWSNNKIYISGTYHTEPNKQYIFRFNEDGTPDNTFNTTGKWALPDEVPYLSDLQMLTDTVGDLFIASIDNSNSDSIHHVIIKLKNAESNDPTSIKKLKHDEIQVSIFPNPVKDKLKIQFSKAAEVNLYNIAGQRICYSRAATKHNIDMSGYSAGLYFITSGLNSFRIIKTE